MICEGCKAGFRSSALVDGLCAPCRENKGEEKVVKPVAETLNDKRVRDIVHEILAEAGIKRKLCDKCGELYFAKSPNQKICPKCKAKQ